MSVEIGMIGSVEVDTRGRRRAGRRTWLLALVAGVLVASSTAAAASSHVAKAATRYASPHGVSNGTCSQSHPCAIGRALSVAQSGDTVIILTGRYGSASTPIPDFALSNGDGTKLTIRGEAGKPAPVISTGESTRFDVPDDSTMSHVTIHHYGGSTAFYVGDGAVADDVDIVAAPESNQACLLFNGTLIDSTCFAEGTNAFAINTDDLDGSPSTIELDGVDAIASGDDGIAVHAQATYGSTLTLNITNTIMEGAEADLYAGASDVVDTSIVTIDHSDYRTVETDPTGDGSEAVHPTDDVTARPLLRDVLGGDFRELPHSVTIDAGTAKAAPRTDLAGNQRVAGRTIDIGAYEFEPVPALTHSRFTKAHGGVHAAVRINPGRLATTVRLIAIRGKHRFSSKPKSAGAGRSAKRVTLSLGNLASRTTYRVYLLATSSGGRTKTKPVAVKTR